MMRSQVNLIRPPKLQRHQRSSAAELVAVERFMDWLMTSPWRCAKEIRQGDARFPLLYQGADIRFDINGIQIKCSNQFIQMKLSLAGVHQAARPEADLYASASINDKVESLLKMKRSGSAEVLFMTLDDGKLTLVLER